MQHCQILLEVQCVSLASVRPVQPTSPLSPSSPTVAPALRTTSSCKLLPASCPITRLGNTAYAAFTAWKTRHLQHVSPASVTLLVVVVEVVRPARCSPLFPTAGLYQRLTERKQKLLQPGAHHANSQAHPKPYAYIAVKHSLNNSVSHLLL
jgi:hypothetical protein